MDFSIMKEKYLTKLKFVGNNIRERRLENKWSQEELAKRCDTVNAAKISKMENAREDYNFSTLLEVCDALEVNIAEVVGGK